MRNFFLGLVFSVMVAPALAQIPDHPVCQQPKTARQIELCAQLKALKQSSGSLDDRRSTASIVRESSESEALDSVEQSASDEKIVAGSGARSCGGASSKETALRGFRIGMSREEAYAAARCALGPWDIHFYSPWPTSTVFGYRRGPPEADSVEKCVERDIKKYNERTKRLQAQKLPTTGNRLPPGYYCKQLGTGLTLINLFFNGDQLSRVFFGPEYLELDFGYGLRSANVELQGFSQRLGEILGVEFKRVDSGGSSVRALSGVCEGIGVCGSGGVAVDSFHATRWYADYAGCNCQIVIEAADKALLKLEPRANSDAIRF